MSKLDSFYLVAGRVAVVLALLFLTLRAADFGLSQVIDALRLQRESGSPLSPELRALVPFLSTVLRACALAFSPAALLTAVDGIWQLRRPTATA